MNKGVTVWFTGLSGAGKSTIANHLYQMLDQHKIQSEILDGDALRDTLCKDLGFSEEDRKKNIERVIYISHLLNKHNILCLVPVIAPYKSSRDYARSQITHFLEIYVHASLDIVIDRDVKGLYKKALAGEIKGFTGIDAPYEKPENPDLTIETEKCTVDQGALQVYNLLIEKGYINI